MYWPRASWHRLPEQEEWRAFVATDNGWTLLASDAAWSHLNYQQMRLPLKLANLIMDNPRAYVTTLQALQQLHQGGAATIHLSHEGQV
ncbi:hypothetical protein [Snodgrassella alvi]|uniref:hypothetical protein n=1 Tax=Snodgrassella alvi TaxID=1196083 RepID=UPI0015D53A4C|nr:hypothetical protein [Snodgrassella alvi]